MHGETVKNIAIYVMFNFAVRISLQVGTGKKREGIDCNLTLIFICLFFINFQKR